jgi:hypothetical protein
MTKEQLLDLLREARGRIGSCECGDEACEPTAVFVWRIDAALADAQNSAKGVVEWYNAAGFSQRARINDWQLKVYPIGSRWCWEISHTSPEGWVKQTVSYCFDEAEAKSAAIAAARGVK